MARNTTTWTPDSPAEALPPYEPRLARKLGFAGIALTGISAVLEAIAGLTGSSPPVILESIGMLLVFVGVVTAGAGLSMRPDLSLSWGTVAVAGLLGSLGTPEGFDSFRPLLRTVAAIGLVGAVLVRLSTGWRVLVGTGLLLFHFGGIFTAATSPPTGPLPAPWIIDQAWTRVVGPYLQFVYLRNAYQYYSPDPGPASILAFLLKTETGKDPVTGRKEYKTQWVVLPRRPTHVRDPLGLSYYRRLSLTEHLARGNPGFDLPSDQFEKSEVWLRRFNRSSGTRPGDIPFHPLDSISRGQYRLPNPDVLRYLLPSYASHVVLEYTPDKETAARTTVKVYRLEHRTLSVEEFLPVGEYRRRLPPGLGPNPYHPATYRPFFLGEFDARGNLVNPQEDFLYWMIPILPRYPGPNDPNPKTYDDYLSVHALDMTIEEVRKADENEGRVFNWSQLR
jgi:hypothetical protein